MKILQAILTLLTLPVAESLRFQSSSVVSEGRNYLHASKVLQVTLSFKDASRSAALRPSALWHSKGEANDDPYLQHVCPSCSYIYDESKGFKKRHPPGKRSLTVIADYDEFLR